MAAAAQLALTEKDGVSIIGFTEPTVLDAYHVDEVSKRLFELLEK